MIVTDTSGLKYEKKKKKEIKSQLLSKHDENKKPYLHFHLHFHNYQHTNGNLFSMYFSIDLKP